MFVLGDAGFQVIGQLMMALLNEVRSRQCERSKDYTSAKNCIILSQTFHCEATNTHDKFYLQHAIQGHSLWREIEFWEKAIQSGIEEEVKQHQQYGLGTDDVGSEAETRLKCIVFGQVSSYIHVMMTFSLQAKFIEDLVRNYAEKFDLDRHDLSTLMTPFMPPSANEDPYSPESNEEVKQQLVFEYSEDDSPSK
jgi:hypothetical protein